MRRWKLVLCLVSLLALVAPATVAASSPPPDSTLTFGAGEVCPFAIRIDDWILTEQTRTISGRDGTEYTIATSRTRSLVTNLEGDDETWIDYTSRLVYWEPGDGTFRLRMAGRQLFYFLDGDQNPEGEGAGLFVVTGVASETLELSSGIVTSFRWHGRVRDVCAGLD